MRTDIILNWAAKLFIVFIFSFMFINITTLLITEKINLFAIDSPLLFAFLIAMTMLICFVITICKEFKAGKSSKESSGEPAAETDKELLSVVLYVAGVFLYSMLVRYLHFMFGSVIFLSIAMIIMNTDKAKVVLKAGKAVIAAILTIPVLYYVFHGIFNVMLP